MVRKCIIHDKWGNNINNSLHTLILYLLYCSCYV